MAATTEIPVSRNARAVAASIGATLALALAATARGEPYQFDLRSRLEGGSDQREEKSGLFVEPRIESALMLVGNINLAEDPADEVDVAGIEAAPGFYASYFSPRAQGYIDYSLIGRVFEDSDYNQLTHRLTADGSYAVLPDWLKIQGQAMYTDGILDPTRGYNYGGVGLFGGSNITQRASASISPVLSHEFRDFKLDARYRYGRVWYLEDNDVPDRLIYSLYADDSIDQDASVSLSTNDERYGATGRVYYEWQDSEFGSTVPYRYERAGVDAGFRLTRTTRFVADGGMESDLDESTKDGGLDSGFWHAGFEFRPDERSSIDVRYGERFFGESWSAKLSRETRYLTLILSYEEDPEVETRRVGINFDPDQIPVPDPDQDLSGYTSYPYVRKDATASLLAKGARTKLRLDVYDRQREYINAFPPNEETQGVRFNALRDLGANLYAEFDTRYDDVLAGRRERETLEELRYHYYDWNVLGRVTWEAYRNFQTSAEAGYLHRSGSANYDGEWLAFRFRYTF
jgi:hypothetical protein